MDNVVVYVVDSGGFRKGERSSILIVNDGVGANKKIYFTFGFKKETKSLILN